MTSNTCCDIVTLAYNVTYNEWLVSRGITLHQLSCSVFACLQLCFALLEQFFGCD